MQRGSALCRALLYWLLVTVSQGAASSTLLSANQSLTSSWVSGSYFQFSWSLYNNDPSTTSDDTILLFLSTTSSDASYLGLGTSGDKMNGVAVIAYLPLGGNASSGGCELRQTFNWGVGSIVDVSVTYLSSMSGGGRRTVACLVNANSFGLTLGSSQRVILATGGVDAARFPQGHGANSRETGRVDFVGNTATIGLQTGARTVGGALLHVAMLVWVIIGGILHYRGVLLRPAVNTAFAVLFQAFVISLMGMYFGLAYKDLTDSAVAAPVARAFAHTTSMAFMLALYPVPKCFGFISVMGSSYDRVMSFHAFNALFVWIMFTLHWITMSAQVMDQPSDALSNSSRYVFSPITGFLSWLLVTIILVLSYPLKAASYKAFKVLHYLFIPAVLLAIIHYPSVLITIAIPIINYIADLVLRAVGQYRLGAVVESVTPTVCPRTYQVVLRLKSGAPPPPAGAFTLAHLGLGFMTHPFNVAWYDVDERDADEKPTQHRITIVVREAGPFTQQVKFNLARMVGESAGAMGWYGSLQVPLTSTEVQRVILVAGGMGITWILRLAQCIGLDTSCAPAADLVVILWFIPDRTLYEVVADKLRVLEGLMGARLRVDVFVTQGNAPTDMEVFSNSSFYNNNASFHSSFATNSTVVRPKPIISVYHRRPCVADEIVAHAANGRPTAVYVSAPPSLASEVRNCVNQQLPMGYLCEQQFALS